MIAQFTNSLSIANRLYLSFGILIVVMIVAGLTSVFSVRSLENDFTKFTEYGAALEKSSAITRKFMDIQIFAKNYVSTSDEAFFDQAEKAHIEIEKMIEKAIVEIHDPKEKEMLLDVQQLVEQYWQGFEKLHKDRLEQKRVIDVELHAVGSELQKEIVSVHKHFLERLSVGYNADVNESLEIISDAVIHLLIARDHANRYIYGGDKAELDFTMSELDRVEADLKEELKHNLTSNDRALITDAIGKIAEYRKGLEHYTELADDVIRLETEVMSAATAKINKDLHIIEEIAIEAEHKIEKHVHERAGFAIAIAFITLLLSIAIGVGLSYLLSRMISRPLGKISTAMIGLSGGNLNTQLPTVEGENEIARMTRTLHVFKDGMVEREKFQQQNEKEQELKEQRQDEVNQLVGIFGATIKGVFQRVSGASMQMSDTAESLTVNADSTNKQAVTLSKEAEESAHVVTLVSSAAEELNASITDILARMEDSATVSERARDRAAATSECFQELLELSRQITSIVDLINEIAEQTNLLALNATIEAARAGDAGKGFAVVASEVKELANQTAKATGEIGQQVDGVLKTASRAEEFIETINSSIDEIFEATSTVTRAVSEQQSATAEIARSVESVATSARRVEETVSIVKQSADEGYESSVTVKTAADSMIAEAETLSNEVETFLGALGNSGDQDDFKIYHVDFAVRATIAGKQTTARVKQISTASVLINSNLNTPAGTPVSIELDGVSRPLNGRVAKTDADGTFIQLPLTPDHIQLMKKELFSMGVNKAA